MQENMLEVDCPCVTPEVVLKASGHVDKFTDLMVKDEKTGTCYRADHLIKDFCKEKLEKDLSLSADKAAELKHVMAVLDDLSSEELGAKIKEYGITAPDTKNPLSDPYPFNLMFQTSIGPSGVSPGFMRPETAQGIFVNFKDLYYYNGNKLPFAAAQIGQAFRNEISPRQGLLRVREFTLAEIEHFVDPQDKSHKKFPEVANLEFLMFPRELQVSGQSAKKMVLGEAVSKGTVNNETLGYFIGRVYIFLTSLGIDKERLRFRQHLANEMAHYAADCWDAEIESSYGWIECVGIADRSAYDLRAHTDKSGVALVAHEKFAEPIEVEMAAIASNKIGAKKNIRYPEIDEQAFEFILDSCEASIAKYSAFLQVMPFTTPCHIYSSMALADIAKFAVSNIGLICQIPYAVSFLLRQESGSMDLDVTSPRQLSQRLFLKQLDVDLLTLAPRMMFHAPAPAIVGQYFAILCSITIVVLLCSQF